LNIQPKCLQYYPTCGSTGLLQWKRDSIGVMVRYICLKSCGGCRGAWWMSVASVVAFPRAAPSTCACKRTFLATPSLRRTRQTQLPRFVSRQAQYEWVQETGGYGVSIASCHGMSATPSGVRGIVSTCVAAHLLLPNGVASTASKLVVSWSSICAI
jgi:hypothetical protein